MEPNPLLPRKVSPRSYEGVIKKHESGEELSHFNYRYLWSVDALYDQLGDAIAFVD